MRRPIERSCMMTIGKGGVVGSMVSVCAGHTAAVLFGDAIVDDGIHWIRPCMSFVAIYFAPAWARSALRRVFAVRVHCADLEIYRSETRCQHRKLHRRQTFIKGMDTIQRQCSLKGLVI